MHTGAGGCVHLARSPDPDCLKSQTPSRSVPLCCFGNNGFKLTASNRPSTMKEISLLTQPAFPLKWDRFSPLQVRVHTGLFEELPPRATVQKKIY
jgi:hypothetical protein